jgi:hypothetical protein
MTAPPSGVAMASIRRTLSRTMAKQASLAVSDWSFADPQNNARGLSFSQISAAGTPVAYTFEGKSHFEVSTYGLDGQRKTPGLQLQLSRMAEDELDCVMACVQHEVVQNAAKFGMTPEDARARFKSPFSKNGTYPANLRVKTTETRYWKDGALTAAPESHADKKWQAVVLFKSLWFAPDAWGISAVATDLQETCESVECPF